MTRKTNGRWQRIGSKPGVLARLNRIECGYWPIIVGCNDGQVVDIEQRQRILGITRVIAVHPHPDDRSQRDREAGFFGEFSARSVLRMFAMFDEAAGDVPVFVPRIESTTNK